MAIRGITKISGEEAAAKVEEMEKEDNVVDKDMEKWQGEDKEERTAVGRGRTVWQEKRKKEEEEEGEKEKHQLRKKYAEESKNKNTSDRRAGIHLPHQHNGKLKPT